MKRVADPDNANKVKVSANGQSVTSEGLEWKPNPFDEYAIETALRLIEDFGTGQKRGEIVVVSLGPDEAQQQVRQGLAMGADRGVLIAANDDELDATVVTRALAKLVAREQPDLVILGKQAVDGDSNQVGQMLAAELAWPQATFAGHLEAPADLSSLTALREVDGGAVTLKVQLPAVLTVDLRIVAPEAVKNNVSPADKPYQDGPRYASLKGIMAAKKKPIDKLTFAELGVDTTRRTQVLGYALPPARKAGAKVATVEELVEKLRHEAKAL